MMAHLQNQTDDVEKKKKKMGKRVILFPLPFQGHLNPMLQLANILYSQGFSITIIHTTFNPPTPLKYPNFTFHSISVEFELSANHPRAESSSTSDMLTMSNNLISASRVPFHDCLVELLSHEQSQEPFACLITDSLWFFAKDVAEKFKLSTIVLRTGSVFSFLAYAAMSGLRDKGYLPVQASRIECPVHELPPYKVKDLPVIDSKDPEIYHHMIDSMVQQIKVSAGLVFNSYEELESEPLQKCQQDFAIPIFLIGPFHKQFSADSSSLLPADKSCISWLDNQSPSSVLYVSFGSAATVNHTEFQEIAWGLASSRHPFLWVVRPGLVHGFDGSDPLPNGFMESVKGRGYIVNWAPQQQVLAHPSIGAFWTHCGWNSTLESLCEGVPMICQPAFGDQKVNARFISDAWKVGIHSEYKLERGEIERAIKRVMVEEEGQRMRELAKEMKEKINIGIIKEGSSFTKSLERLVNLILSFN